MDNTISCMETFSQIFLTFPHCVNNMWKSAVLIGIFKKKFFQSQYPRDFVDCVKVKIKNVEK